MVNSGNGLIKTGLIGAGGISEFHSRALKRLRNVRIIGVADIYEARAADLAKRHDIPAVFGSTEELLEQQPDVVHVLTPPSSHAALALDAIHHGCHVVIEKPLATSVEDCDRIAAAAKAAGKKVCVDHSLLRDPFVERALNIVRSGAIGEVVSVDHLRSELYAPYRGGPVPEQYRDGGFPFRDIGVHSLYLLEAFLGEICDATLKLGFPENDGQPRFKEWRVLVQCERGMGHIYLSWNVAPLQNVIIIHGTRGVVRADIVGMSVTARKKGRLPGPAERILNSVNEGRRMITQPMGNVLRVLCKKLLHYHGLQMLVGEFYQSIVDDTDSPVGVEQCRNVIDWTERIARQADREKEEFAAKFANRGTAEILVTGATGFIGNHLLRRLLAKGNRVRILVRRSPAKDILEHPDVEVFLGNLGDADTVDSAVRGIREVYHLGATVEGWAEDFECGTVAGTQNIVDSCLKHNVEKLIYMSSLSVIHAAAARKGVPILEDWPFEPYPERRGFYSQTKLTAELIVAEAVKKQGLRAILLRPGEVVGPDRPFLSGAVGIDTSKRMVVFGNGKAVVPVVWVEDLIDAVLAAAKSDRFDGSAFNIVDPEFISQNEIAAHYLKTTNQKKPTTHFPLSMLYGAAFGLDLGMRTLGRSAPLTPYRLRSAIGPREFDCSAAKETLGWEPKVGIRAGMEMMGENGETDSKR